MPDPLESAIPTIMTDTNFDQWLELKRPQEHVPLSEHYSELQSQQMYEFAYFLVQNLEDSDNNDQEVCPPTPPPSAPSSQAEATAGSGPGSSQGADEERHEADRRSLARLLDMEKFKEEQARRARAAAVKKAALPRPRPRPLPIPIRQPPQNRSPVKQEYESQSMTVPQGQRLPPLRVSREPRTPSRRQMTPPVENPMRQGRTQLASTPPQEISPPRQQNGSGGVLFDAIYETISKRLEEKINSHVEEFASEMQSLRNQMKRERALMEYFLKEKFGLKDDDCAKFWNGLNRQLRDHDGQSLAVRPSQPPTAGNPTRAHSVIPSVEESIRIKRERLGKEGEDEFVGEESEDERVNEDIDQVLDRVLDEVLVEHQDEDEVSGEGLDQIKLEAEDEDEGQQQEAEREEAEREDEEDEEEQEAEVEAEVEAAEDDHEAEEEDSPEPDDSDDPDYYDPYDIEKTPVPIEILLGIRRAPSGVKRKAQEMEDDEEEPQPPVSLKRPAWVQVVSPVPNPHLRQQARQLQTVRKWYKEGGSRNPVVLE